jgi:hypothetical protein
LNDSASSLVFEDLTVVLLLRLEKLLTGQFWTRYASQELVIAQNYRRGLEKRGI